MSQQTDSPNSRAARDEAAGVGRATADAGRTVAETAATQADRVAGEARRQARGLFDEAREQLTEQARSGQRTAAQRLHTLADELRHMAGRGDQGSPAGGLARQAADRAGECAEWLERAQPGDLLEEVRGFAARRPGTFLLGAAVAGLVVGRLTRGAVDARQPEEPDPEPEPVDRPGPRDAFDDPGPVQQPAPMADEWTDDAPLPPDGPLHVPDPGRLESDAEPDAARPPGVARGARPGTTTVGEYVDELRGGPGSVDEPTGR